MGGVPNEKNQLEERGQWLFKKYDLLGLNFKKVCFIFFKENDQTQQNDWFG